MARTFGCFSCAMSLPSRFSRSMNRSLSLALGENILRATVRFSSL